MPVCCGIEELKLPYYYNGAELTHLLLMSWAGTSLVTSMCNEASAMQASKGYYVRLAKEALMAIHEMDVLHRDVGICYIMRGLGY